MKEKAKKLISIIIPVYRNAGSLHQTYSGLITNLKLIKDKYNYEIFFINDGSDDNSLNELLQIRKVDKKVKIINFVRNFGQLSANLAGFHYSKGDLLIHISADLQDPPNLIIDMIRHWEKGNKIVAGTRSSREDTLISKISSRIFYRLIKVSIPNMPVGGFDFFLLDKKIYKTVLSFNEHNSFLQGDLLWLGYKPYFIKYKRLKRKVGKSQWTFGKKFKYFIDAVISTSYLPIRAISFLGFVISLMGFFYAIIVLLLSISHSTPFKGYAPIMIVLLITSGLIIIMLGIIGEYLWRIYDEVRQRSRYIIKDIYM